MLEEIETICNGKVKVNFLGEDVENKIYSDKHKNVYILKKSDSTITGNYKAIKISKDLASFIKNN